MKRFRMAALVMALGLAVAPGVVLAKHEMMDPGKKAEKLKEKLTLTDPQTEQVRAILEKTAESNKTHHEAIKQNKEQADQQISAVLNEEQKAKYTKMQEERREKMKEWKDKKHDDHSDHEDSD